MASPNWRTAVAKDGDTACSTLQHEDGSISIRLSAGAVSIVASISPAKLAFLFETTGCAATEPEAA